VPAVGLLGIYLPLLFPDGRLPSRRWRPLAWLAGVVIALASVGMVVLVLLPLCILASALSLILRYRRSGDEEREQIKWLAFAASLVGLGLLGAGAGGSIFAPETTGTKPLWLGLLEDVVLLSYASIPVAVGFAVLKYRLYDIDVVINRTLIYGSLTLMLALLYFGSVIALQFFFSLLTGQGNTLAIVATTLAIAALFNPLRRRIQSFIDRRFYRRKYDARNTLEAFGSRLRDETDLERIAEDLAEVVDETMQPSHISLWLSSFPSSSANSSESSSSEVRSSSKQSEPPSQ
jgi:MFS family permease